MCIRDSHKQAKREVAKAINLIPDKDTFQKILKALLTKDRSRNLQLRADIVIPLMREACLSKSEILQEWSDLLREKFFELKRK